MTETISADGVRNLMDRNDVSKAFLERLANRTRSSRFTTVEHVIRFTRGTRKDVVELFKSLEELGLGAFIPGRRGGQSRFEWHVRLTDVGQAAIGEVEEIEQATEHELEEEDEEDEEEEGMVSHEYTLRPGAKVEFSLPSNLTQKEADRLAMFIKTLPFTDE
jgi:DNA-binding MarR family transcriptional regulator